MPKVTLTFEKNPEDGEILVSVNKTVVGHLSRDKGKDTYSSGSYLTERIGKKIEGASEREAIETVAGVVHCFLEGTIENVYLGGISK